MDSRGGTMGDFCLCIWDNADAVHVGFPSVAGQSTATHSQGLWVEYNVFGVSRRFDSNYFFFLLTIQHLLIQCYLQIISLQICTLYYNTLYTLHFSKGTHSIPNGTWTCRDQKKFNQLQLIGKSI